MTIAAIILAGGNVFYRGSIDEEKEISTSKMKVAFSVEGGDMVTALEAYRLWEQEASRLPYREMRDWCIRNCVLVKTMQAACKVKGEMLRRKVGQQDQSTGSEPIQCDTSTENDTSTQTKTSAEPASAGSDSSMFSPVDMTKVRRAIAEGFFLNLAIANGPVKAGYTSLEVDQACVLHPSSTLVCTNNYAEYIVYHALVQTSRLFMRDNTVIEKEWIQEINAEFYASIKQKLDGIDKFVGHEIPVWSPVAMSCIIGRRGTTLLELQRRHNCVLETDFERSVLRIWARKAHVESAVTHIEVGLVVGNHVFKFI